MNPRLEELLARYPVLSDAAGEIARAFEIMRDSFEAGGKLLLCGNGGSAADCEHWAGELLKGFSLPRPLTVAEREGLPDGTAERLQRALPAIPLTGFPALRSAFENDVDPSLTNAQLVWALGQKGDCLAAISTSGTSPNILKAVEVARARGVRAIGLTNRGGGRLVEMAECCIRVPEDHTYRAQELHLPVYHALCLMLEDHFFAA